MQIQQVIENNLYQQVLAPFIFALILSLTFINVLHWYISDLPAGKL